MKTSHRDTPLYVPAPADRFPPYRRETEHRLESDIGEDERNAAREWLRPCSSWSYWRRAMTAAAQSLLALASQPANRIAARCAWVRETVDALGEAQRARDARCTEAVMRLSEEEFERLCDEEEAKVAAIRAQIDDVIERDVWPRHLYWSL